MPSIADNYSFPDSLNHLNLLVCDLHRLRYNGKKFRLCLLYCPPSATIDILKSLRSVLFKLADVQNRKVITLGETNLPNIDWVNHFSKDTKGTVLLELCLQLNLTQWATEPTRDDNILDIVLSSSTNIIQHVQISPPSSNCDHNAVHFLLQND